MRPSNASGAISPGEIVTLYGVGLGPAQLISAAVGADGLFDAQLGGVTVSLNNVNAPVLYASATQVAVIVPYATSGSTALVILTYQGLSSPELIVPVANATPGVFTADSSGQGQAAALNSDGSPNSRTNAAHIGDEIVLFATGAGQTIPAAEWTGNLRHARVPAASAVHSSSHRRKRWPPSTTPAEHPEKSLACYK